MTLDTIKVTNKTLTNKTLAGRVREIGLSCAFRRTTGSLRYEKGLLVRTQPYG